MDDENKNINPESSGTPSSSLSHDEIAKEQRGRVKWVARVLGGDILQSKWVLRQIPLVLLCVVYCLGLVLCRYTVEGLTIEKHLQEQRLDNLNEQRNAMQKSYQESIKISQIAAQLDSCGVGITAGPPYEI